MSIKIKVMKFGDVDTFIYEINGKITVCGLQDIEKELIEYEADILTNGDGLYSLDVDRDNGEYTEYGQCIYPACWDFSITDFEVIKE